MEPCEDCPRYERCSVNNCPLHPEYPNLYTAPGDFEKRCTLGKARRLRIASRYPGVLKLGGKTRGEIRAERAWSSRSPEAQKKALESLKKSR